MFRKMRRFKQLMPEIESEKILKNGITGVLSVMGDEGYPYSVPLNYVYYNNKVYFHSAYEGHKIDSIKRNDKVCFCVILKDEVIPEKLSTRYESVICFGKAKIIQDEKLKLKMAKELGYKYCPFDKERVTMEIERFWDKLCMVEITLEQITGKKSSRA